MLSPMRSDFLGKKGDFSEKEKARNPFLTPVLILYTQ
jgi:hypothetical protein